MLDVLHAEMAVCVVSCMYLASSPYLSHCQPCGACSVAACRCLLGRYMVPGGAAIEGQVTSSSTSPSDNLHVTGGDKQGRGEGVAGVVPARSLYSDCTYIHMYMCMYSLPPSPFYGKKNFISCHLKIQEVTHIGHQSCKKPVLLFIYLSFPLKTDV